jgi:hypothetical protein
VTGISDLRIQKLGHLFMPVRFGSQLTARGQQGSRK